MNRRIRSRSARSFLSEDTRELDFPLGMIGWQGEKGIKGDQVMQGMTVFLKIGGRNGYRFARKSNLFYIKSSRQCRSFTNVAHADLVDPQLWDF